MSRATTANQASTKQPGDLPNSFNAKISDDGEVIRALIPSPLLKRLGAKGGDEVEFYLDAASEHWLMSVKRGRQQSAKKDK